MPFYSNSDAAGGGGGGGEDLAATLILGNITGSTDISVSSGQKLTSVSGTDLLVVPASTKALVARDSGNARGANAVDLQILAGAITDVASAPQSTIGGGTENQIHSSVTWGVIAGGISNNLAGGGGYNPYSTISGGARNYIGNNCYGATIVGGTDNYITEYFGYYSSNAIAGGAGNRIYDSTTTGTGSYNSAAFGSQNKIIGSQSAFAMGIQNRVVDEANYAFCGGNGSDSYAKSSIIWGVNVSNDKSAVTSAGFGNNTIAYNAGSMAWGSASSALNGIVVPGVDKGAAQATSQVLAVATQNASATRMTLTGHSSEFTTASGRNVLKIRAGMTCVFNATVSAAQTGGTSGTVGDSAGWFVTGVIKRNTTTTTVMVAAATGTGTPSVSDAGAAAWEIAVAANDSHESLIFTVTGEADKNIVWSARVDTIEAGNPQ